MAGNDDGNSTRKKVLLLAAVLSLTIGVLLFVAAMDHLVWCMQERDDPYCSRRPLPQWREFRAKFANVDYRYKMSVPSNADVCKNASLFVFVLSRPDSFDVRSAIRNSWAEDSSLDTVIRFVIGGVSDLEISKGLLEEQAKYGDLILYTIEDAYRMLQFKTNAALEWQQAFCNNVKFVLKIDDDIMIDLQRLRYWIKNKVVPFHDKHPAMEFGFINARDKGVYRDVRSKWYVSIEDYPDDSFPPFLLGGTYLLSNEAVAEILSRRHEVNAISVEDVLFTGLLAKKAGVHMLDARPYIRIGENKGKLYATEICEDGNVPLVTVLFQGLSRFHKAADYSCLHNKLRSVQCCS